jgi:hypothetical protein
MDCLNYRGVHKNMAQEMVCFEAGSHLLVQRAAANTGNHHTQLMQCPGVSKSRSVALKTLYRDIVLILVNVIFCSTQNQEE